MAIVSRTKQIVEFSLWPALSSGAGRFKENVQQGDLEREMAIKDGGKYLPNFDWRVLGGYDGGVLRRDLHMHSMFSDGHADMQAMLDEAEAKNIKTLALTDHNCIQGVEVLKRMAATRGIVVLPAVEISTCYPVVNGYGMELHILGYGIDVRDQELNRLLFRISGTYMFKWITYLYGLLILKGLSDVEAKETVIKTVDESIDQRKDLYARYGLHHEVASLEQSAVSLNDETWEAVFVLVGDVVSGVSHVFAEADYELFDRLAVYQNLESMSLRVFRRQVEREVLTRFIPVRLHKEGG
jgi:hypothetical protein